MFELMVALPSRELRQSLLYEAGQCCVSIQVPVSLLEDNLRKV
jgi:hypothetical protein